MVALRSGVSTRISANRRTNPPSVSKCVWYAPGVSVIMNLSCWFERNGSRSSGKNVPNASASLIKLLMFSITITVLPAFVASDKSCSNVISNACFSLWVANSLTVSSTTIFCPAMEANALPVFMRRATSITRSIFPTPASPMSRMFEALVRARLVSIFCTFSAAYDVSTFIALNTALVRMLRENFSR